ncbi:VOC family protein [Streptomyces chiangmaiensis]|uniref:VOC family protein n=1 Tax=Streptomyces chiangmaiensis TaxID=766497 RepID=A0ABU7FTL0_9ACTN|nr:VOC family protein [Streptomyces chiangmaiensis]MED7827168.1 VOC family protein [Streptomyces chiangmaiensis]
MDFKLDLIVLPVSDVDRARAFYQALGFRLDVDYTDGDDFRFVHFTPPGSECSIVFGKGLTSAAPGSIQAVHLVASDIEEARAELLGRGIEVSEVSHDVVHIHKAGEVIHHGAGPERGANPLPAHVDYGPFATFSDPDGNGWVLEEVKPRALGGEEGADFDTF